MSEEIGKVSEFKIGGAIAMIYCQRGGDSSAGRAWVLKGPELCVIGGRDFLCGSLYYPGTRAGWLHERRCCILIDDISSFIEFATEDDYWSTGRDVLGKKDRPRWFGRGRGSSTPSSERR